MTNAPRPFWHRPSARHLGHFLLLGAGVGAWFELIYAGADWITAHHGYRVRVHIDAELAIPFVPAAVVGYMALYPLFWIAPFVLRTGRELRALALALGTVILVAGVFFLLVPARPAFPPTPDCGIWDGPVRFAKAVALTYNLVPSLHVALTTVCVCVYSLYTDAIGRVILWLWCGTVALSTMLLHQHYLIDVVTGLLLGALGAQLIYRVREPGLTPAT